MPNLSFIRFDLRVSEQMRMQKLIPKSKNFRFFNSDGIIGLGTH